MILSWEAQARERLKTAGLRQTRQRIAVLSILLGYGGPLTHQQIESRLTASMGSSIDRVTLYRVLDCLSEHGLAHRVSADDRIWRFAAAHHHSWIAPETTRSHSHFYCTDCGRFLCLDDDHDILLDEILPEGFEGHRFDMTIHGRCADCLRSQRGSPL